MLVKYEQGKWKKEVIVTTYELLNPYDELLKCMRGHLIEGGVSKPEYSIDGNFWYIPVWICPDGRERTLNTMKGVMEFVDKFNLDIVSGHYLNNKLHTLGIRISYNAEE